MNCFNGKASYRAYGIMGALVSMATGVLLIFGLNKMIVGHMGAARLALELNDQNSLRRYLREFLSCEKTFSEIDTCPETLTQFETRKASGRLLTGSSEPSRIGRYLVKSLCTARDIHFQYLSAEEIRRGSEWRSLFSDIPITCLASPPHSPPDGPPGSPPDEEMKEVPIVGINFEDGNPDMDYNDFVMCLRAGGPFFVAPKSRRVLVGFNEGSGQPYTARWSVDASFRHLIEVKVWDKKGLLKHEDQFWSARRARKNQRYSAHYTFPNLAKGDEIVLTIVDREYYDGRIFSAPLSQSQWSLIDRDCRGTPVK
jgi:hypothetical protein